ncbi:MAG: hypothetical protein ACQETH_14430 [Candidatus Rifleibacteriota bacterium]
MKFGKTTGFTFIEAIIVTLVLSLLLAVSYRILITSQRGAIHGQEASLHLMAGNTLALALERDFSNIIPFEINTDKGKVAGPISFSPDNLAADSALFWVLTPTGVRQVRYSYDPKRRVVLREEVDSTGRPVRGEKYAEGYVTAFSINDESKIAETVKVRIEMEGKAKKTVMNRVFCHGLIDEKDCRHWVFHF